MENTIIDNFDSNQNEKRETKNVEVTTEKKLRFNNMTEGHKNKLMSGGAGLVGMLAGAGAFALMGFANKDGEIASSPQVIDEDASECVDVFTDAPIAASVTSKMSFSEAFESARSEVGAGGFFTHNGQVYNTYTKEEWDQMSAQDKTDYANSIADKVKSVEEVSPSEQLEDVTLDVKENQLDQKEESTEENQLEQKEEVIDNDSLTESADASCVSQVDVSGAPRLIDESDVISRVDIGRDYTIDAYEVDFDKDEFPDFVVDADGDGIFDELILDMNNPSASGDIIDIAPLDTSKLSNVPIVDGDGNVLEISDESAIGSSKVSNDKIEISSEDLVDGLDLNGDGKVDSFVINANNNYVDDIAIDLNDSGTIDMVIMDVTSIDGDERLKEAFAQSEIQVEEYTIEEVDHDDDLVSNDLDDDLSSEFPDDLVDDSELLDI